MVLVWRGELRSREFIGIWLFMQLSNIATKVLIKICKDIQVYGSLKISTVKMASTLKDTRHLNSYGSMFEGLVNWKGDAPGVWNGILAKKGDEILQLYFWKNWWLVCSWEMCKISNRSHQVKQRWCLVDWEMASWSW